MDWCFMGGLLGTCSRIRLFLGVGVFFAGFWELGGLILSFFVFLRLVGRKPQAPHGFLFGDLAFVAYFT